jgi:hypothetical protein
VRINRRSNVGQSPRQQRGNVSGPDAHPFKNSLVRQDLWFIWAGEVRNEREAEHRNAGVTSDDHLWARAHANRIGAYHLKEAQLSTRLKRWSTHHGVHAEMPRQRRCSRVGLGNRA